MPEDESGFFGNWPTGMATGNEWGSVISAGVLAARCLFCMGPASQDRTELFGSVCAAFTRPVVSRVGTLAGYHYPDHSLAGSLV